VAGRNLACWRVALAWVALMALHAPPSSGQRLRPTATVTFAGDVQVQAEIVDTPETIERGLMFRKSLGPNEGMLFVFEQAGFYPFWMKNTLIPLDMVFIAGDGTIKHVHANAVPLSTDAIPSQFPVRAVLEINGGSARLLGIKPGDKVKHPIFGNA
jgi:uncharacterized membrane protein (UPF0127 family)